VVEKWRMGRVVLTAVYSAGGGGKDLRRWFPGGEESRRIRIFCRLSLGRSLAKVATVSRLVERR
jgi:hypothetical protein